jgi:hypothetical protein
MQIEKVFERIPLAMLMVGKRRSGKTKLLTEMLNTKYFKKKFDRIYLFSPTVQLDSTWGDVRNKNVIFYDEYYDDTIEAIMKLQSAIPENERKHQMIILDDFAEKLKGKRGHALEKLATKGRHFKLSFIFTTQKYNLAPTVIRNNIDEVIFFRVSNNMELKTIEEEYNQRDLDFGALLNSVTTGYNYLCVVKGKEDVYYRGNLLSFVKLKLE